MALEKRIAALERKAEQASGSGSALAFGLGYFYGDPKSPERITITALRSRTLADFYRRLPNQI